ncbi:hypothetical protein [Streptomyces millisiae]|uniref:CMP/dCMP-type deaminase domain-containing protein n=1 Tax=Streptomyces millisiae TaxID=3075542 RepID=A0ABU2LXW4_9ACTN|nr:hypothetical protein [Streptomyces sp. DSM 44918]MDT0322098.1 hypothetical protein [Streptomyces sp. DSM 44918]
MEWLRYRRLLDGTRGDTKSLLRRLRGFGAVGHPARGQAEELAGLAVAVFDVARRDRAGQTHGAATVLAAAALTRTGHAALNGGARVPDDARFCFYNPLHGTVGRAGPRPVCGPCAERLRDFRGAETLLFLHVAPPGGELTPYYRLPGLFHTPGMGLGAVRAAARASVRAS